MRVGEDADQGDDDAHALLKIQIVLEDNEAARKHRAELEMSQDVVAAAGRWKGCRRDEHGYREQ